MKLKISLINFFAICLILKGCTDVPLSFNTAIIDKNILGFWQFDDTTAMVIRLNKSKQAVINAYTYNYEKKAFITDKEDCLIYFTHIFKNAINHKFISYKTDKEEYYNFEFQVENNSRLILKSLNDGPGDPNIKIMKKEWGRTYYGSTENLYQYVKSNIGDEDLYDSTVIFNRKSSVAAFSNEDNIGPQLVISSPAVNRNITIQDNKGNITITGKATDESGVYSVTINRLSTEVDSEGNFTASAPLSFGNNPVTIVATDRKKNQTSFQFIINRIEEFIKTGRYYAIIIGIQDYQDDDINDLEEPLKDANSVYNVLYNKYTFERNTITFLKNPTRDQIFKTFDSLANIITEVDNLLIFYAGHGSWDEKHKQGYWFPSDARRSNRSTWLTNADLKDYFRAFASKHTLLITDACFGGSIFKSRSTIVGAPKAISQLYELPSREAMTSGTLKEVPDKSVFIEYLVKRLNQNEEKYLTAEELFSSFRIAVINNSPNGQVPQFGLIQEAGHEGGDFIFVRK